MEIALTSAEALVKDGAGRTVSVPWPEVVRVYAYSVDAIIEKITYVGIEHESGHVLELSSQMTGWSQSLKVLSHVTRLTEGELQEALAGLDLARREAVLWSRVG